MDELERLRGELAALEDELRSRERLAEAHERLEFVTAFAARIAAVEDVARRREYLALLQAYVQLAPRTDTIELAPSLERALAAHEARLGGVAVTRALAPLTVRGAAGELDLVWSELIRNAAAALAGAGSLTVFTSRTDAWVAVSFLDDGPGMPASPAPGVGLHLARTFVERHGGHLELESAPGRTRATVALPQT